MQACCRCIIDQIEDRKEQNQVGDERSTFLSSDALYYHHRSTQYHLCHKEKYTYASGMNSKRRRRKFG